MSRRQRRKARPREREADLVLAAVQKHTHLPHAPVFGIVETGRRSRCHRRCVVELSRVFCAPERLARSHAARTFVVLARARALNIIVVVVFSQHFFLDQRSAPSGARAPLLLRAPAAALIVVKVHQQLQLGALLAEAQRQVGLAGAVHLRRLAVPHAHARALGIAPFPHEVGGAALGLAHDRAQAAVRAADAADPHAALRGFRQRQRQLRRARVRVRAGRSRCGGHAGAAAAGAKRAGVVLKARTRGSALAAAARAAGGLQLVLVVVLVDEVRLAGRERVHAGGADGLRREEGRVAGGGSSSSGCRRGAAVVVLVAVLLVVVVAVAVVGVAGGGGGTVR